MSVRIPTAHLLSNWSGVGPCGWPISWRVVRIGTASLALMNPDPVSDSWTEDMTASIILLFTRIGALCGGGVIGADWQFRFCGEIVVATVAGACF